MRWLKSCLTFCLYWGLCSFSHPRPEELPYPYELSVCAIFHNEASYLPEWIEHHRKQGVQFFLLFNNNSTDNYKEVLRKYEKQKIVKLVDWSYSSSNVEEWNGIQTRAYTYALKMLKNFSKWCAFIDTDEFLFCPDGSLLSENLKKYESYGGVAVNWVIYGTSNKFKVEPNERLLNELVHRTSFDHPINKHVKCIVRPSRANSCHNPHYFVYKPAFFSVNENSIRLDGPFSEEHSSDVFRINHYWARDLHFFVNEKIPRQTKWGKSAQSAIDFESECNGVYDPILINE
jgi:glycosyltransferase involved in cell wall biosynthesis